MPGDWPTLDSARVRAGGRDEVLSDILKSGCVGITACLESAPPHRLCAMRLTLTPSHVEELLTRAVGPLMFGPLTFKALMFGSGNTIRAIIMWDDRVLEADTCTLTKVRVHWPTLASELEARGVAALDDEPIPPAESQATPRSEPEPIIKRLAEWIFARHAKPPPTFERLLDEAVTEFDKLKNADFLAAYQTVYISEPHRPPATGWPLRPAYQARAEEGKSSG